MNRQAEGRSATWGGAGGFFAMIAVASVIWCSMAVGEAIPWRSGPLEIARLEPAESFAALAEVSQNPDARHVVVQFDGSLDAGQREVLRQAGIELLGPLGGGAYFAAVSGDGVDTAGLRSAPAVIGLESIDRAWKLDPRILAGEVPAYAVVAEAVSGDRVVGVYVLFHGDVSLFADAVDAVERHGGVVRDDLRAINGLVVELPEGNVEALADEDVVQWIEWPLPRMSEVNNSNRVVTEADTAQAPPYSLDGTGVTVLVYDGGTARSTHVDFQGRCTVYDASGMADHATHVSGTIGGGGVANSAYKGMAPAVTLLSYGFEYDGSGTFLYSNPGDMQDDYSEAISTYGAHIANSSIGTNTETNGFDCAIQGNYGVTSQLIDTIVRGDGSNPLFTDPFRVVWANGNERQGSRCDVEGYGDYYSTAPPAGAKNHIAVGALNSNDDSMTSFSSWGPTDDGRMKPDISAPGCQSNDDGGVTSCSSSSDTAYAIKCGTSMASPTVCGLSSLLLEDFRAQFPAEPDPRNSTLKTLLAHTAVDLGNAGPDYMYGYGSVRIVQAIDFMRTENFFEAQVDQGATHSVLVVVDPSDTELKVTLAWDDYPGTPNVDPALVNDLDLRVFDPSNGRHYPWTLDQFNPSVNAVQTQENHVDNIEQVLVNNPDPGVWRIEIHGYAVPQGPQSFSLCASPLLVNCSSTGTMALDSSLYGCTATAGIQVIDCDLNTDDGTIQTVNVTIESTTEPGGETVLLTETGPATADFRGSIQLDPVNGAGVLQVADGDTITATYIDADDGQGGINVPVTANATVDCTGPVISSVQVTNIGSQSATVTFDTDEAAVGTVRWGLSCGSLTESASESGSGTSHSVELTGLDFATQYDFAVDAEDSQGNSSTDDNGGACYSFSTPAVAYDFPLNSDPGWTTSGDWAFGTPTGGGSYNGDPTSGFTGSNVYGYNLAGDYANNLPATYLTTTAIDCSGLSDVGLSFRRWLGVESNSNFDEATIEVSNNGSTWTVIWRATDLGVDVADTSWQLVEYDISAVADNQATVYIRWGMGPTDGGLTYPGWNIDDVQIIATGGVLSIAFPNGLPDILAAETPRDITVRIIEGDESYVPGSGTLYYRYYGGSFTSVALVPQGGDLYTATLPAAACDATPEFYFSAEGTVSGVVYSPPTAPAVTHTAVVGEVVVIMEDNFEADQGWTTSVQGASSGLWERGVPVNDPSWDYDPASDSDGSGQCYLTQNVTGNTDVDGGNVLLMSPAMDMSGGEVTIGYDYFLRLTDTAGGVDRLLVEINNNGGVGTWIEIARHDTDGGLGWRHYEITQ
ncbi:MAG TPA: S8 family serine peptidase, partial [Phycisphaerae bacterium]|nr:S8 family serine peptidase [Phycisphaerae bacterium]